MIKWLTAMVTLCITIVPAIVGFTVGVIVYVVKDGYKSARRWMVKLNTYLGDD